jgi:hypothetical protein
MHTWIKRSDGIYSCSKCGIGNSAAGITCETQSEINDTHTWDKKTTGRGILEWICVKCGTTGCYIDGPEDRPLAIYGTCSKILMERALE